MGPSYLCQCPRLDGALSHTVVQAASQQRQPAPTATPAHQPQHPDRITGRLLACLASVLVGVPSVSWMGAPGEHAVLAAPCRGQQDDQVCQQRQEGAVAGAAVPVGQVLVGLGLQVVLQHKGGRREKGGGEKKGGEEEETNNGQNLQG